MDREVSVVIPYSPDHTPREMLEEAKESVFAQSVPTELIVEDDEQGGPAPARNIGLDQANARYVAFLDADDLWEPNKLERQLRRMDETGTGLCVEGDAMSKHEFIRRLFVGGMGSLTSSILVDTERTSVRFEESLARREDHLFMLEAAHEAGVCFCDDLVTVRKHESGISATTGSSLRMDADFHFLALACRRVPECKQHITEFHRRFYHHHGRLNHFEGNYRQALSYFVTSLRIRFRPKTFAAFCLSVVYLFRQTLR